MTDPTNLCPRGSTPPAAATIGWSAVLGLLVVIGCSPYQLGNEGLFPPGIQTVHVPIAVNDTFRHDLGPRLTEAVIREIELRTPYKVTGDPNADSVLVCRIVTESKRVLTETFDDDPRALDALVSVTATWSNRNGQMLLHDSIIPANLAGITFSQDSRLVPEAGQSVETQFQDTLDDIASRIVSQMELRW